MRLSLVALSVALFGCSVESPGRESLGAARAADTAIADEPAPAPTPPPAPSMIPKPYPVYNATVHVDHAGACSIVAPCKFSTDPLVTGSGACAGFGGATVSAQPASLPSGTGWQCSGTCAVGDSMRVDGQCLH